MEMYGRLLQQLLDVPIVFFEYEVTVGQFFFFICLAAIVVRLINGILD